MGSYLNIFALPITMKIVSVVGTRPNFIKFGALVNELKKHPVQHVLVHTGQHYDKEMSALFFDELGLPTPDINLDIGSGNYCQQLGTMVLKLEQVLRCENPDMVIVVGDVNSTLAGAFVAHTLGIRVAHVEAGLRSFDLTMPEEINRILTDNMSDFLFTTEKSANENLRREGISKNKVFFVGNVMIDTLLKHKEKSERSNILEKLYLREDGYAVVTLHRPSNVDTQEGLRNILSILSKIQDKIKLIFPMHPRTRANLQLFHLDKDLSRLKNVLPTGPLGYLDFLHLMSHASLVLTDSGGVQEETTVLGVPCITLRNNTERPITIEQGTNILVDTDPAKVIGKAFEVIHGKLSAKTKIPALWDGHAAERILHNLIQNGKK